MTSPLLDVHDLVQHYQTRAGTVYAVDGVTFTLKAGETLGIVGESGCGKSSLARSIAGLNRISDGRVYLEGTDITRLGRAALLPYRSKIQMVFQNPAAALNPRLSVGRIIEEPLVVHNVGTKAERRKMVAGLMEKVGLRPDMADRLPHELSGGQKQRVCIARALALKPKIIICDEAVSALDVSVQAQVVNLLRDLQEELGVSYLFIAHGLHVTRHISHNIAVMYLGRIVEYGPAEEIFTAPLHPYTRALIAAAPSLDEDAPEAALLEGELPSPLAPPKGCHFAARCPQASALCHTTYPSVRHAGARRVACHLYDDAAA